MLCAQTFRSSDSHFRGSGDKNTTRTIPAASKNKPNKFSVSELSSDAIGARDGEQSADQWNTSTSIVVGPKRKIHERKSNAMSHFQAVFSEMPRDFRCDIAAAVRIDLLDKHRSN